MNAGRHALRWLTLLPTGGLRMLAAAAGASLGGTAQRDTAQHGSDRDHVWELSDDLLIIADHAGRPIRVSPSWERVLGYSATQLASMTYRDVTHPDDVDIVERHFAALAATHAPTGYETRMLTADGAWRIIAWKLSTEPHGQRVAAIGRDVTHERAHEAELARAREVARQSQKMEAIGLLTSGLTHDFNNLLGCIAGSLELAQQRLGDTHTDRLSRHLLAAQSATRLASGLTQRLLAFARKQVLQPQLVDLNRLVADMEDLIRRVMGVRITVLVGQAGASCTVLVDPNQMENALLNLCINARDAMAGGGTLRIDIARRDLDQATAQDCDVPPGPHVYIGVTDTGAGMSPAVSRRAFEPFFTTKTASVGTGLGLSTVYGFARQSSGHARIVSVEGQGTTVGLYLPCHAAPVVELPSPAEPQMARPRVAVGTTVMVVDDDGAMRILIADVLEELGYTVIEAEDGAAGLRLLASDARIDLLVTDLHMPGTIDGDTLAQHARSLRGDIQVLFITGSEQDAPFRNDLLVPERQVLVKPFGLEMLAARIGALICV